MLQTQQQKRLEDVFSTFDQHNVEMGWGCTSKLMCVRHNDELATELMCVRLAKEGRSRSGRPLKDASEVLWQEDKDVLNSDVVPRLVELLTSPNSNLAFEATWALTNIAGSSEEHSAAVIRHGAVPIFITLLGDNHDDDKARYVWALGWIARGGLLSRPDARPRCRDLVLGHGALSAIQMLPVCQAHPVPREQVVCGYTRHWMVPVEGVTRIISAYVGSVRIFQKLPEEHLALARQSAWALYNFSRGKPQPAWNLVLSMIEMLRSVSSFCDVEILKHACWALSHLFVVEDQYKKPLFQILRNSDIMERLLELLEHELAAVRLAALSAVGNIPYSEVEGPQLLQLGFLDKFPRLLTDDDPRIRQKVCHAIHLISAVWPHTWAVIEANLLPSLIHMMAHENYEIAKMAMRAIHNTLITRSPHPHPQLLTATTIRAYHEWLTVSSLVEQGVIPSLCSFLKGVKSGDFDIFIFALDGLKTILRAGAFEADAKSLDVNPFARKVEECGGVDTLRHLQSMSASGEVLEMAANIRFDPRLYFPVILDTQDMHNVSVQSTQEDDFQEEQPQDMDEDEDDDDEELLSDLQYINEAEDQSGLFHRKTAK